jgi:HEPN domain-containing protein/predicted nucleotidyltransferase
MLRVHDPLADPFLAEVTRTIANHLRPSRVVLFGSRARGDDHADSDYDLLVEMETDLPRTARVAAVYASFDERPPNLDVLVLTADEYEQQRDDVGTTAYAIHREGRVLYAAIGNDPEHRERARVRERRRGAPASLRWWLRRAENDLRAMEQLLVARDAVPDAVCFHAHQAAEKLLKSTLIAVHQPPPRTHDLMHLLGRCPLSVREDAAAAAACGVLSQIWPLARYPADMASIELVEPSVEQAHAAVTAARAVRDAVLTLLSQLPSNTPTGG